MSKDKSIYSCFHPSKIWNKYVQDYIVVPCGTCDYCTLARSADLKGRVQRESLDPSNGTCLFVTLTYDNDNLPVYELSPVSEDYDVTLLDGSTQRRRGFFFYSNREGMNPERYAPLSCDDVSEYYEPVNYNSDVPAFGHLCYDDCRKWLDDAYNVFRCALKYKKKQVIDFIRYEQTKFRYFLCGEYGPTSGRPHYHALLWFKCTFTERQLAYVSKVLSTCWTFGDVDIQSVKDGSCADYVASYVTSSSHLPEVLRVKSVRPFCTFSKFPSIGAYQIDREEVQKILDTGVVERLKFDANTSEFVQDGVFPSSFFRRYFPKCSGFGYKDDTYKLRIYSYVYNYFKDKGISHTEEEVYNLSLSDIEWPFRIIRNPDDVTAQSRIKKKTVLFKSAKSDLVAYLDSSGDMQYRPVTAGVPMEVTDVEELVDVQEWDYRDKYAALVCYRYCVMFGYTPDYVVRCFLRLYSVMASGALGTLYDKQNEEMHHNTYYVHY